MMHLMLVRIKREKNPMPTTVIIIAKTMDETHVASAQLTSTAIGDCAIRPAPSAPLASEDD